MDQFWRYETKREVLRIDADAVNEQGELVNQGRHNCAYFLSFETYKFGFRELGCKGKQSGSDKS